MENGRGERRKWRLVENSIITTEEHAVLRVKHWISSSWQQEVRNVMFVWTRLGTYCMFKTYVLRCKSAIYRFV